MKEMINNIVHTEKGEIKERGQRNEQRDVLVIANAQEQSGQVIHETNGEMSARTGIENIDMTR